MASPVSESFGPWRSKARKDDSHDAILVFRRTPNDDRPDERRRGESRVERRARAFRLAQANRVDDRKYERLSTRAGGETGFTGRNQALTPSGGERIDTSVLPYGHLSVTPDGLRELEDDEDILAVIPNQPVKLLQPTKMGAKGTTWRERQNGATWGLTRLGIPRIWYQTGTMGEGARVAVLDTGVDAEHPALVDRVHDFVLLDPQGRTVETNRPFDASNHGTHVCGTIAGGTDPDGVAIGGAPSAELIVAAVLAGDSTVATVIGGILWAARNGADVISMSLGFTYYEPKFEEILRPLWELDILPVVAIGNERHGNTSSPGNVGTAFSVGATAPRRNEVAVFSSGASFDWPGEPEPHVVKPDVVAPGVGTYSCVPAVPGQPLFECSDGTSMATPHVAAVVALLMSAKPNASALEIANALRRTAHHPSGAGRRPDNRWGWGELRPSAALRYLDLHGL